MIVIPDTVLNSDLKESEKTLFGRILGECLGNAAGACTLSNAELAERCGCTFVTVSNGIKALSGAGLIQAHVHKKKANERTLTVDSDLLKESLIALTDLLKKTLIVHPTIKEIFNSPIKENFKTPGTIKDSFNSPEQPIKDSFNSQFAPNFLVSEQLTDTIKNFFNSRRAGKAGFSIRATKSSRDSILINNILYNTLSQKENNLRAKNRKNDEGVESITVQTPSGRLSIAPAELSGIVEIRGANPDLVAEFVLENAGNHYNNIPDVRNLVRAWLKQQARTDRAPKATIDERRQAFRDQLNAYHKANPKKYPVDCYREFFDHWTQPTPSGRRMLFETKPAFDLPTRLAYSFNYIYQPRQERQNRKHGNVKQTLTITADELAGSDPGAYHTDVDLAGIEAGYTPFTIEQGGL